MTHRRTHVPTPPKPDRRRSGTLPGRRLALGVIACLAALALTEGGAVADGSGTLVQATVHGTSGPPTSASVSLDYLQGHTGQCPGYSGGTMVEFGRTGEEDRSPTQGQSWTLGTILGCLQPTPVPGSAVTGITVTDSSGAPESGPNSLITAADLQEPHSDFLNPAQNPVVWFDGNDRYDRPQRNSSDLDFLDEDLQGNPIAIDVYEGPLLTVTATASPTTVTAGHSIQFSADVSPNDGALTYNWNFGGGAQVSHQASPNVQFNTAGIWTVNLQVTDPHGGGGGDQTTVTVNPTGTSSTPTTTGSTTTGPDKSSGTTPAAPPSIKKHKSGTQPSGQQNIHGNGQGNTSHHTQTTTTTTSTSTTPTTTTQATTTPAGGSSAGGSSGSSGASGPGQSTTATSPTSTPGAHHRAPRAPTHHRAPAPTQGKLVDGELISDITPLPANSSPLVHLLPAASAAAPARQAPVSHSHIVPVAAGVLAVLVLLGFGAQRELGYDRHWRGWLQSLRAGG